MHSRSPLRFTALAGIAAVVSLALTGCSPDRAETTTQQPTRSTASGMVAVVHRTPTCGCCKSYEEYLRKHGYTVQSVVAEDLDPIKREHNIPADVSSCHTTIVDGLAIEGHVPVEAIDKFLRERPAVDAIAVPGMPLNSPGMGEPNGQPLEVVSVTDGRTAPFLSV